MERWVGKVAVVTGASVGIGPLISQMLAQKGMKVVGIARRVEKLEEIARSLTGSGPGKILPFKCDIGREEDIVRAIKLVWDTVGNIHVLVNNAGFTRTINFTDGASDDWKRIFDVNVIGLCLCTREVVRGMRDRRIAGHVLNLNSAISHCYVVHGGEAPPLLSTHSASKFAVTALTDTLRQELRQQGDVRIKVTIINCGVTKSQTVQIIDNANQLNSAKTCTLNHEEISNAVLFALSTSSEVQIPEICLKPWD